MKTRLLLCTILLALPFAANAQKVVAHCYDLRVNKVMVYTGNRDTIKELKDYGQVKVVLPTKTIYFPLHQCITEFYN